MNERRKTILEKLTAVPDRTWLALMAKCHEHIRLKLKGKTLYGAHSPARLGEANPQDYYFKEAVTKLYDDVWDWKFEQYSLEEQLVRIIDSMISEEVRKVTTKKGQAQHALIATKELDVNTNDADDSDISEEQERQFAYHVQIVQEAIQGDDDLEYLFDCLQKGNEAHEICRDCGWTKDQLYKKTALLKAKVKAHAKNKPGGTK
ncbi:MAG: hypothetical protein ACKVT2_02830 [Saprospiraceae bacterium]